MAAHLRRILLTNYWKTLAITSATLTSSYVLFHDDQSKNRFFSLVKVQAAEYERRNARTVTSRSHRTTQKTDEIDDDDDTDEREDKDEHNFNPSNARERRFLEFASVEYDGDPYMTPVDFLESLIADHPRPRIGRRQLTDAMAQALLYSTPPKHRGSKKFFRSLEDSGLISFTEYLFLWVILTKPHTQFEIAFAMFDTDGNNLVDKREFLVLGKVLSDKRMSHRHTNKTRSNSLDADPSADNYLSLVKLIERLLADGLLWKRKAHPSKRLLKGFNIFDEINHPDTTLLLHFFGKNGRDTLNYKEFRRFMENLQTEMFEIEFNTFSHGFKTISDLDFTEILLRYTDFDRETKKMILKKVKKSSDQPHGVTFEQFKQFFFFLNNLDEFNVAMRFHQLSNKPISQAEFQRAVKISTGFELPPNIIALIFRIFDADDDQHLSYDEFMAVMKDRLSRGFQSSDTRETTTSKFDQFKRCVRERAKSIFHGKKHGLAMWKSEMVD